MEQKQFTAHSVVFQVLQRLVAEDHARYCVNKKTATKTSTTWKQNYIKANKTFEKEQSLDHYFILHHSIFLTRLIILL